MEKIHAGSLCHMHAYIFVCSVWCTVVGSLETCSLANMPFKKAR